MCWSLLSKVKFYVWKKQVFPLEHMCQAVISFLLHCRKDLQGNFLQRVNSRHNILLMLSKERCLVCWIISEGRHSEAEPLRKQTYFDRAFGSRQSRHVYVSFRTEWDFVSLRRFCVNVQRSFVSVGETKTDKRKLLLWGFSQVERLKQDLLNKFGTLDRPHGPKSAYLVRS